MKVQIKIAGLIEQSIKKAQKTQKLPPVDVSPPEVDRPGRIDHGDFACALPLRLAKIMKMSPIKIAEIIIDEMQSDSMFERVWVEPPGFINFSLTDAWLTNQVDQIRLEEQLYGNSSVGDGKKVQVEFVSVNPTGPIHVGHARGAVFGSALANVLEAAGYQICREYYVNDSGNQIENFSRSILARYLQSFGKDFAFPEDGYKGNYMMDIAEELKEQESDRFLNIDEDAAASELGVLAMKKVLDQIKLDMQDLRVTYDEWFHESSLYDSGQYQQAMDLLKTGGYLDERDGALWFSSAGLNEDDEQGKVFVRSNGSPTYFAADVAYHYNKFKIRDFYKVINIWGADHQGQVPFMKSMAGALGVETDRLTLLLYQLVTLKRGGEVIRVSKRSGDIVTLRELVDDVGVDACRFFFLSRSPDSQMEFDIDLATKQSAENPVYYVQYAYARIVGIMKTAKTHSLDYISADTSILVHASELTLIRKMLLFPELIEHMAESLEPHHLPHYAVELATEFQRFYEQCRVVSNVPAERAMSQARLKLVDSVRIVLLRCLNLMSMSAPEEM